MGSPRGSEEGFGRPFLTADWRWLAMLNYAIDAKLLAPFVPCGTELDLWKGETYVSVVGFLFENTRVLGMPVPFHRNFEEVNLRFYVRHKEGDGWRRGTVFIKEIVPRRMIAVVARRLYNENYVTRPMRHAIAVSNGTLAPGASVEYTWGRGAMAGRIALKVEADAYLPEAESRESFIVEHYWGYVSQRDGGTKEYRVDHVPWRVWECAEAGFEADVGPLYGEEFIECLGGPPRSALLAEGSRVSVFSGHRLALSG